MPKDKAKNDPLQDIPSIDLVFHFKDPALEVVLEDGFFDEDDEKEIISLVNSLKESIWIDRTYAEFKGTNYSDVFLTEDGWKSLCKMLFISKFGKNLHPKNQEQVVESYIIMIICYIYSMLEKYGWGPEHIMLKLAENQDIEADIYIDLIPKAVWKSYRGPWQDWEENNY